MWLSYQTYIKGKILITASYRPLLLITSNSHYICPADCRKFSIVRNAAPNHLSFLGSFEQFRFVQRNDFNTEKVSDVYAFGSNIFVSLLSRKSRRQDLMNNLRSMTLPKLTTSHSLNVISSCFSQEQLQMEQQSVPCPNPSKHGRSI